MGGRGGNGNYWPKFIRRYTDDKAYWYIPKGKSVADICTVQKQLRVLAQFEGQRWRRCQKPYWRRLRKAGLSEARTADEDKRGIPISRMLKHVFTSSGFAWINGNEQITITDAGREFLRKVNPATTFARQVQKYQFWNPSVRSEEHKEIRLHPLIYLLEVLVKLENFFLTIEEYILFCAKAKAPGDADDSIDSIRRWRKLGDKRQESLISEIDRIKIGGKGRRGSIYNTIKLNSPYAIAFWTESGLIEKATMLGKLGLRVCRSRIGAVRVLIAKMKREGEYIDFENQKDWMAFYGDPKKQPTRAVALEYYEDRSEVERAVEVQEKIGQLKPSELREYRSIQIKERDLENLLENNLDLVEPGLSLIGRQYSTLAGPIDLLARDQAGKYVVIELKRGRTNDRVVGQILRYLTWVQGNLARGSNVRGIIVCHSADKNLQAMLAGLRYKVAVREFGILLSIN
ncbi:MAG: AlwI family type II restriction endonuclease [Candidatus Binataceae bacterium]